MYCQPPLQSWGTFSLEKKSLIFLQRSTGRFSRGVRSLFGRGGRVAGEPNAPATGKRGVRGLTVDLSALPYHPLPATWRPHRYGDTAVRRVASVRPLTARLGTLVVAAGPVSLSCSVLWRFPVHPSPLSFPFYSGQEEEREKLVQTSPSLPSSSAPRWHPEKPEERSPHCVLPLFISTPRLGFCSSQEIVIHRACFFAKCNYPRPCVYGRGMVESNRK